VGGPVACDADVSWVQERDMRLCRFNNDRLGSVEGDIVRDVTAALDVIPPVRWPLPVGDRVVAHLDQLLLRIEQIAANAPKHALADVRLLSPVANPGDVLLTGTPEGVGAVVAGDLIVTHCQGIGGMTVPVKAA
jgi:hypothetical protein